jgi:prevent-host-death family protein
VSLQPEISQRDLRTRSKEIMDAVEAGQSFTVTRDGHEIGELVPLRRRRRFIPRLEFAATSHSAPTVDLTEFRADQDAALENRADDPYAR